MKKIAPAPKLIDLDSSKVSSILSNPDYLSRINHYNEKYYHWDELRYRVEDSDLEGIWYVMKLLRNSTYRSVHVCDIDLKYNLLPSFQEYLFHIDRDSAGLINLENPDEKVMKRYVVSSIMEEAIASSQLEGAATTRKEAKRMLRSHRTPINNSERMIVNNYEAMEYIKKTLDRKMDIDLILELHRIITKGTLSEGPQWEGRFREDNETVVGSTEREDVVFHVPPEYARIPDLIHGLCDFINDTKVFIHPIIKGILIHFLIGYIHPFVNGNGRLARTLFYWYVMKNDYWLMEYTSISRILKKSQTQYGLAYQYTETDDNDITYFIKFNLSCIEKAVNDLRSYIKRKSLEQKEIMKTIESNPELNMHEMTILKDYTKEAAVFSIRELSNRYPISYQSARNYVSHLCELGYLKAVSKERKTVLYSVSSRE